MSLREIADALVAHCKNHTEDQALNTLYAEDAVSIEAVSQDGSPRETQGLDGIRGKHAWWAENFTVHSGSVEGPFLHGDDRFAVIFSMDAEFKATGDRSDMREVGVYTVANGKIIREEFYYTMP